uniref:Globin domain-containing protein n=1 Tax=Romanomermis culicivorax TaxID=13658 RepID=A0A915I7E6_ROMCU
MGNDHSVGGRRLRSKSHPRSSSGPFDRDTTFAFNQHGHSTGHLDDEDQYGLNISRLQKRLSNVSKLASDPSISTISRDSSKNRLASPTVCPGSVTLRQKRDSVSSSKDASLSLNASFMSEASYSVATLIKLTPYQVHMIQESWPCIVQSGGNSAGSKLYRTFANRHANIGELFKKISILASFSASPRSVDVYKEHGRLTFDLINEFVLNLHKNAESLIDKCRQTGAYHSPLKHEAAFNADVFDDLAEIIVEQFSRTDAVRKHRGLSKAWTLLITFILEKVREGYCSGLRRSSSMTRSMQKKTLTTVDEKFLTIAETTSPDH